MCAVAYWSRRAARLHSSIRGLSPQAGGFRRRSNTTPSVGLSAWLKGVPERLPCVQQVVTSHLLFRIILQYAAVFQPRVLFLFRGTRNILPTDLIATANCHSRSCLGYNFRHEKISRQPSRPVLSPDQPGRPSCVLSRRRGAYVACGPRPARLAVLGREAPGLRRTVVGPWPVRRPSIRRDGTSRRS